MRILDVLDNRTSCDLSAENGLSLYIEKEDGNFLFDTGSSGVILDNLKKCNIKPCDIQNIVLSHNHNDHTGGLKSLLDGFCGNIYLSADFLGEFYKVSDAEKLLSDNSILEEDINAIKVDDKIEILDNVFLCRVKNPQKEYKCMDKNLFEKVDGKYIEDEFRHEIYIAFLENKNIHIISACTHIGIINVIDDALERFLGFRVKTIIGGLHIKNYGSDESVINLAKKLNEYNTIEKVYTCHCTGERAEEILSTFGNFEVIKMSAGRKIDICKTL